LRVHTIPISAAKYSVREQVELPRRCHQDKLDAFHSPFFVVPFAASCPVVATMHDLIPFLFRIYSQPKQWVVKSGYRASALRAAHIIAVSQAGARDIRNLLGVAANKISVVYNAVSRQDFHPHGRPGDVNYLLDKYGVKGPYVLISNPRNWRTKNVKTASEVLASVRKRISKKFQTVVYGYGKGAAVLAGDNQEGGDTLQIGFVTADDLGMLFCHAQAFLLTSLYEGFGLPLLEAMSCGCPVVTSKAGSLAEVAGDGAQVFDPMDVCGMSEAVASLLCDPDQRELWRARALSRAAEFSWRKAAEQTIAVYRHVTGASDKTKVGLAYSRHAQNPRD